VNTESALCFLFMLLSLALAGALFFLVARNRRLRAMRDAMLQEKEVIYSFVHDVSEVFIGDGSADMDQLLKRVLFYALRTAKAGAGAIYLRGEGNKLEPRAITGIFPPLSGRPDPGIDRAVSKSQHVEDMVRRQPVVFGEGLIGTVADLGTAELIADAERDVRVPQYAEDFLKVRSLVLVPMRFQQEVMGVLAVVNRVDGASFVQSDLNLLQSLADQASVSVHFVRLREALDAKQRLDRDLEIARKIQSLLLPKHLPRIPGFEVAASNIPALEVGGDYYDVIPIDETHWGLAIADVSGKGISGAIMMAICRSIIRSTAVGETSPSEVLRAVNRLMRADFTEDMFVSILYMVLDTEASTLTVARAGHERPILFRGDGSRASEVVESPGVAVGLGLPEQFDRTLQDRSVTLRAGDVVVACTDGITEAMNARQEEWGVENFLEAVSVSASEGAHSVINNLQQRVVRFIGEAPQYDDMTLIALRKLP